MIKKFSDLNEQDNIETISSVLKTELDNYKKEYEVMKQDGIIDEEELKRIIETIKALLSKAKELKDKMTNEKEISIMNDIISILLEEQEKMINASEKTITIEETSSLTQN